MAAEWKLTMCRIAGILSASQLSESLLEAAGKMGVALQHGGPDDAGTDLIAGGKGCFVHRRLSIIDLSAKGHQPMHFLNGRYSITYNGEIYNFRELRAELEQLGCRFSSHTDTEVILAAHHYWGLNGYTRFKGMFAFALYDHTEGLLTLARDPSGIKPLYYAHQPGCLVFASEVRAFKAVPGMGEERSDWPVYLLAYGHLPEPVTTLRSVQPLPKGCYVQYRPENDSLSEGQFDRFSFIEKISHPQEALELVRRQLEEAVQRHLLSDAPLGVFLSGGLDSGIIALLAAAAGRQPKLRTLSLHFAERGYSEKPFQDELAAKLSSDHHACQLQENDFHATLPKAWEAMDLPCCDGLNTWFISRFARECGVKAVLSGIGGDELLGGYPSFSRIRKARMLTQFAGQWLRSSQQLPGKLRRICYLSIPSAAGKYLFLRGHFIPREIAAILNEDEASVWRLLEGVPVLPDTSHLSAGNEASWLEINLYMQNQLLRDADVMGMAHGVEIRVPFLDPAFLRTVLKIQSDIKYRKDISKYLLVEAFRQELPRDIWNRPKMGFTFPFREWFSDDRYRQSAGAEKYHQQLRNGQLHYSQFITLQQLHLHGGI